MLSKIYHVLLCCNTDNTLPDSLSADFDHNLAKFSAALHQNCKLSAEKVHLRLVERFNTCRVSVRCDCADSDETDTNAANNTIILFIREFILLTI